MRASSGTSTGTGSPSGSRPELLLRASDGFVEGGRGDRLALERGARGADLVAQALDDPLRLCPGRPDGLVAFAPRPTPLLLGEPQRVGGAYVGGARPVERGVRLAFGRLDRRQGRLERPLGLGQSRAGVVDDLLRQAEPLGDRERLAPAGQADRQSVRRRQRLEVELDRGVACARVVWAYALSSA